jgi:signal transduction histidine kinase
LPLALIFATFGSQAALFFSVRTNLVELRVSSPSPANVALIAHWLLLWPTVAVVLGWKYRLRHVLLFALAISGFNIIVALSFFRFVSEQSNGGLLALVFISLAMVTIGSFVRQISLAERSQRLALIEANSRLAQYAGTLEQLTVSRERNHLARELHDTLAHTLSGLAVQLEAARVYFQTDPAISHQLIEQSLDATRDGLHETRRALQSLRASPLEDLGLVLALEQLARSAAERAGLALELQLPTQPLVFTPMVEQCLYRVAQEAIANVVWHSAARQLLVRLTIEEQIMLEVRDDGIGFVLAQAAQTGHYGLVGMSERAALVGGVLMVTSHPGAGTAVIVTI